MSPLSFLTAFALTFVLVPSMAKIFLKKGITGVDLHKEGEIEVPEMVGTSIFFTGLLILVYHYLMGYDDLLFPLIAYWVIGTLGVVDGFIRLSALQKITSFYLVGAFLGWGLGYRGYAELLLIGFLFMSTVNFTNMLAGFNGLEIGTGAIAAIGLSVVSYISGESTSFIISSTMAGSLLAFLYYNRFPARVFPGDVGTLIIGSALFSAILLGKLYVAGVLIFLPYALDAALKFYSAGVMTRESQKPTRVKDGKLYIPPGSYLSLPRLFLQRSPMTEENVVKRVWMVEALSALTAVLYEALL